MLTHVVCWTMKDGVDPEEVRAKLATLEGQVPVIRSFSVGVNVVPSDRAYDVALVATFDSVEDFDAYTVHPYHQEILAWMGERRDKAVAVDFLS